MQRGLSLILDNIPQRGRSWFRCRNKARASFSGVAHRQVGTGWIKHVVSSSGIPEQYRRRKTALKPRDQTTERRPHRKVNSLMEALLGNSKVANASGLRYIDLVFFAKVESTKTLDGGASLRVRGIRFTAEFVATPVRLVRCSAPAADIFDRGGPWGRAVIADTLDRSIPRGEEMPPEIRDDLQAELKRLRKENAVLRQERDILKKAAAFFAKEGSR